MASVAELLAALAQAWTTRPDEVLASAGTIADVLAQRPAPGRDGPSGGDPIDERVVAGALDALSKSFDERADGFGGALVTRR